MCTDRTAVLFNVVYRLKPGLVYRRLNVGAVAVVLVNARDLTLSLKNAKYFDRFNGIGAGGLPDDDRF